MIPLLGNILARPSSFDESGLGVQLSADSEAEKNPVALVRDFLRQLPTARRDRDPGAGHPSKRGRSLLLGTKYEWIFRNPHSQNLVFHARTICARRVTQSSSMGPCKCIGCT